MKFLTDEDFNGDMIKAARRTFPSLDLVRAIDCGLKNRKDPIVLEFAAQSGRILLSHDRNTIVPPAKDRIQNGLSMPGVLIAEQSMPIREFLEEIALILNASEPHDYVNQIQFLPL